MPQLDFSDQAVETAKPDFSDGAVGTRSTAALDFSSQAVPDFSAQSKEGHTFTDADLNLPTDETNPLLRQMNAERVGRAVDADNTGLTEAMARDPMAGVNFALNPLGPLLPRLTDAERQGVSPFWQGLERASESVGQLSAPLVSPLGAGMAGLEGAAAKAAAGAFGVQAAQNLGTPLGLVYGKPAAQRQPGETLAAYIDDGGNLAFASMGTLHGALPGVTGNPATGGRDSVEPSNPSPTPPPPVTPLPPSSIGSTESRPPVFSEFGGDTSAVQAPGPALASATAGGIDTPPKLVQTLGNPPGVLPPPESAISNLQSQITPDTTIAPVVRIPGEAIGVNPKLMQFKSVDDTDTGTNQADELKGQWDPLKAGNLLLYQPIDPASVGLEPGQQFLVANGHHRFAFGESQDVPSYNAQIIREADGYSVNDARTLAAEINIADGKGTPVDQVKLLRNLDPAQAQAVAESAGTKGEQAAAIAFGASDDLYHAFINEQLSPDHAETIARLAPVDLLSAPDEPGVTLNASLQRMAIQEALDGSSAQSIGNLIQAARLEANAAPGPEQFDLFGADDRAMTAVRKMAAIAGRIQGEVSREISATDGALRSATTARAKGIAFERPVEDMVAENQQLKLQRQQWNTWAQHPEMVQQVRDYAAMQRKVGKGSTGDSPVAAGNLPAARTLIDRLEAMKDKGTMPLQSSIIPGLDPATWRAVRNTALDLAIKALQAGKLIKEALDTSVAHIKALYPQADEAAIRADLEPDLPVRQRVATIQAGEDVSGPVKTGVAPDALYTVRPFAQLVQDAQDIMRLGADTAFKVFQDRENGIPQDTRNALGAELEKTFRGEEQRARAAGDTAKADAFAQKQVDLWRADAYGTDLAQGLNSRKLYEDSSPQAKLRQAQELFDASAGRQWDAQRPGAETVRKELADGNTAAAGQLRNDPAANAAARPAIDQAVTDSPAVHQAVVMELAAPWSQSKAILDHARSAVAAKANELLNVQPRPPQLTARQHLSNIMGDLANRAGQIAADHYQGAEPGKTLSAKFQERLGLDKPRADKLAQTMDKEFARQVEAAKAKLPQRIANQRVRQAQNLNVDSNDSAVDKAIRAELQKQNTKLGNALTQGTSTVDAAGKSVADRIMDASGLTGTAADQLRATLARRWEALATAEKSKRLEALTRTQAASNVTAKVRGMFPDLIKLTNLGAFDSAKYFDMVKKKLGLPVLTDDLAREITRRANALEKIPAGDLRDRASVQLLNYVAQQRGVSKMDVPLAIYLSNMLSGIKTPAKILFENGTLLAAQTLSTLRNPTLLAHPVAFVAKPWAEGQLKGMLQALEVMRSGIVTGVRSEQPRPASLLEQRPFGKYDWINIWKYPLRLIAAAHVPMFKPAMDLKAAAIAAELGKSEGLKGAALVQRAADIMGNTPARVAAAKAQAFGELKDMGYFQPRSANEGIISSGKRIAGEKLDYQRRVYEILDQGREAAAPGITERSRNYALHYTYLNEPYGYIGAVAKMVNDGIDRTKATDPVFATAVKTQIPFAKVASNVVNEGLNWTPLGAWRAFRTGRTGEIYGEPVSNDPDAVGDLYARSVAGAVLAAGVAALVAKQLIQINGGGPPSMQANKQWRDAGNEPWSVTVGGRRYSYANTPMKSSLAVLGAWQDFLKYGKGDQADGATRGAFALKAILQQSLQMPMLTGLRDFLDAMTDTSTTGGAAKLEKLFVRTAGTEVVPKGLRDIDQVFDPQVHDSTGIKGMLASQVPFVRRSTAPVLNRLGEPVQRQLFSGWTAPASPDEVWRAIAAQNAWIPEPDKNHIVGDKKLGPDFYRVITADELYDVVKETGPQIRERLQEAIDLPTTVGGKSYAPFMDLEPDEAKELVGKVTREEEAKAYARLR